MDAPPCQHAGAPCADAAACACTCEACQEAYEAQWAVDVSANALCADCGLPLEGPGTQPLTLERLHATQGQHFYQPCPTCLPRFRAFMAAAGLCETCRGPAPARGTPCPRCTCVKKGENDETFCTCLQCSAEARAQAQAAAGVATYSASQPANTPAL